MPLPARNVDYALVNKLGFHRRQNKHTFYTLDVKGRRVARTMMSHGIRELSDAMLSTIARQLRISRRQLEDIIRCTLSRDDYLRLLGVEP